MTHATDAVQSAASRRTLRIIAGFEALKGLIALAAGLGLLSLLHHDLHHLALSLIGHLGLEPGAQYPALILRDVDKLLAADLGPLLLAACGYVTVRFFEAYGLWQQRSWGEWLGALSGALYLPFELRHMMLRPTFATAAVIAANLAVVGFLAWLLWRQRSARVA